MQLPTTYPNSGWSLNLLTFSWGRPAATKLLLFPLGPKVICELEIEVFSLLFLYFFFGGGGGLNVASDAVFPGNAVLKQSKSQLCKMFRRRRRNRGREELSLLGKPVPRSLWGSFSHHAAVQSATSHTPMSCPQPLLLGCLATL